VQTQDLSRETLRRLSELRPPDGGRVVSAFLSLDPSEFATPPARATAVRSLVDEAHRRVQENARELSHDAREALKGDLERVRRTLENDLPTEGAHAVAVFASAPLSLFEVLRLPRPVGTDVVIGDSPHIEPLVALHGSERRWVVLLSNSRTARILRGTPAALEEVDRVRDQVHSQAREGGNQQQRRQRAVENEREQHFKHAVETLRRHARRRPFDRLLVGGPGDLVARLEEELDGALRERLAGRVDVDVEHSSPEQVLEAARPLIEEDDARHEREALDRMQQGVGAGGRGAAGLADTLEALSEQRVQTLLIDYGFSASGKRCPTCGWLGVEPEACPADGTPLEPRDDVVEDAVERALAQSAEVLVVRRHEDLGAAGGIGAVLRF